MKLSLIIPALLAGAALPVSRAQVASPPTSSSSGISGNTMVDVKYQRGSKKPVKNLAIGDVIEGLDERLGRATCSVEAVGHFGQGPVYGNYTADHLILNSRKEIVEPNGYDGEIDLVDKYAVLTSCPVGIDESGVGFTSVDSDFLGDEPLSWSDYALVHKGILNIVKRVGPFPFSPSTYTSMEVVKKYTGMFSKTMLMCAKDCLQSRSCAAFERAATKLVQGAMTETAQDKVRSTFVDLGSAGNRGSVAAVVANIDGVRRSCRPNGGVRGGGGGGDEDKNTGK